MAKILKFHDVSRIPKVGDNCAVACIRLEKGTKIELPEGKIVSISHFILITVNTCCLGHRFAITEIPKGQHVYSWGLEFGTTLTDLHPGDYLINRRGLEALKIIDPSLELPTECNFDDRIDEFVLDEKNFKPAEQLPLDKEIRYFDGYKREGNRGVGTRNYIVVIGLNAVCGSYAQAIVNSFGSNSFAKVKNIDGLACVRHTEDDCDSVPHNIDYLLRTISGFICHPNTCAAIVVTSPSCHITKEMIDKEIEKRGIDISKITLEYIQVKPNFDDTVEEGRKLVNKFKKQFTRSCKREPCPLSDLTVALQCGGSDAFSGISANPLQGNIASKIIKQGGKGILAETDELIGAGSYILDKVKDLETAKKFLHLQSHYEEWAGNHGMSAQSNPSGGNFYRGLYNITIKSLGAAMKKPECCRLDYCLEYGEGSQNKERGYYFMDSPGNDIESVAGQVASGCNIILFSTGNGSVTNHPFVPIIKLMTTTGRYDLLSGDIDVNAGEYLDGKSMEQLTEETFERMIRVCSGEKTQGEIAGHSQVQIWRNWYNVSKDDYKVTMERKPPSHPPYTINNDSTTATTTATDILKFDGIKLPERDNIVGGDNVFLVLPTSLCSGQVAMKYAYKTLLENDEKKKKSPKKAKTTTSSSSNNNNRIGDIYSRIIALPHTEGCGEGYGDHPLDGLKLYDRVMIGHLSHNNVRNTLLLEHGCEKTLIAYFDKIMKGLNMNINDYGQASIQNDHGIDKCYEKVENYLKSKVSELKPPERISTNITNYGIGIFTHSPTLPEPIIKILTELTLCAGNNGMYIVTTEKSSHLTVKEYNERIFKESKPQNTCLFGEMVGSSDRNNKYHIMQSLTESWIENLVGIASSGVNVIIAYSDLPAAPGHPFVTMIRIDVDEKNKDADLIINDKTSINDLMELIVNSMSGKYNCQAFRNNNVEFQIPRTDTGVSL